MMKKYLGLALTATLLLVSQSADAFKLFNAKGAVLLGANGEIEIVKNIEQATDFKLKRGNTDQDGTQCYKVVAKNGGLHQNNGWWRKIMIHGRDGMGLILGKGSKLSEKEWDESFAERSDAALAFITKGDASLYH